ncbi:MEKHLA domain-containing protein [Novosphingobium flavum]|uniref:MEKHLA domain-containing protein n=1 Tax=Novosphingobium flavum TaxID=1778672 RepID=A0A7X1KLS9_9SPHN|nr:MEKHLA domain-containing protein [Novosphingobium flavum]MBC2665921.1 MEKHLA domain-containing protein [Novosphingobium flavum]
MWSAVPPCYRAPEIAAQIALIAESHARLLGRPLVGPGGDVVRALWEAPIVIVAHGTEADPLFFFGNAAALARFACPVERFVGLPSRFSAEAPLREERQALLERVSRDGFIADYAGVRIAATGARFRIEQATVWNLVDAEGTVRGQAAAFDRWTEL